MLAFATVAGAHVVPSMTVEAEFQSDGGYALRINVDPRTFLAPDPTTLPPVPASWYREQTPEQIAATHERAQYYLAEALGASETIAAMQLLSKESLYKSLILMGQVVLLKVRSPPSRRPLLLLQRLRRDCSSW